MSMSSDDVLRRIDEIAATASKNAKQALLNEAIADPLFKRVCEYAYNPFKTYGVVPDDWAACTGDTNANFDVATWTLLDRLVARTLTGNAARDAINVEFSRLNSNSAELLWRVIRKDLRAGFSESSINKACKGLIPEFPYMRCTLLKDAKVDQFDWATGVLSQEKADGMFANLDVDDDYVALRSRQGSEFPMEHFGEVVKDARAVLMNGTQTSGELLVMKGKTLLAREVGNGVLNSVLKGGSFASDERPIFMVWDQVPLTAVKPKGRFEVGYRKRLTHLILQLRGDPKCSIRVIETKVLHSLKDCFAHYGEKLRQGKEGTIIKDPNAIWMDGTSKWQVKLKLDFDCDLKIVAIVPGREGTKNEGRAGSFTCESSCGGLRVDVTVKNEALRDRVDANPEEFIDRIITVVANDIMKPSESSDLHSLFLPRMVEADYRLDKSEADSLERVIAQKESAIERVAA